MQADSEDDTGARIVVRAASAEDYPMFARLFPELLVDDPVPSAEVWTSTLCPSSWIATRGAKAVGFCYFQEYVDTGYVRNIVVAPSARRSGVGLALMRATAERLRSRGKRSWRLNVMPNNPAALALYARMGMRVKYVTQSLRFPWTALPSLPIGNAQVRALTPERDAALEPLFDLPSGQLAAARALGRVLLEASSDAESRCLGMAVVEPKFPRAFPFRIREPRAATALVAAMRVLIPVNDYVNLVVEDDAPLAALLQGAGASLRDEILHLEGPLDHEHF
jgi:ribosomal protein S18 acetylase RimI-like enzyme